MISIIPKSQYTYKLPLLGNRSISFSDVEPDLTEMPIAHIDMDITERCNLACSYCFKGKLAGKPMDIETAKQAVRFLVSNSGHYSEVSISLVGGEPLLAFDLLEEWVPWTKRYCIQRAKSISIGITTNGTVFEKKHHDFFRKWHVGLHLSFDGCPEVQNCHRKFRDGRGTSETIEKNLPLIFSCWRTIHARSTVTPETVSKLAESYKYFCNLGFLKVAFAFAESDKWNNPQKLRILKVQFNEILKEHWRQMKSRQQYLVLTLFDSYVKRLVSKKNERNFGCGAGRGSVLVDINGFLWPCHRFSSSLRVHKNLILGSIWGGFNNRLRNAYNSLDRLERFGARCIRCKNKQFCFGSCIGANWQENANLLRPSLGHCRIINILCDVLSRHVNIISKMDATFWNQFLKWKQTNLQ